MSVQPLKTGMKFVKLDNNKKTIPKIKENVTPKSEKNDKYSYHREPNGNVDVEVFMDKLLKKISSSGLIMGKNIYDDSGIAPIEVDIKKELYLNKLDENHITVDTVVEGKVNNKLDKLRALRKK